LDRTEGSFGFIDSFLFVYRGARRVTEINLSEHGVVTPKALIFEGPDEVAVAGYGSDRMARVSLRDPATPKVEESRGVPGVRMLPHDSSGRGSVGADPLLDAWVVEGSVVPVPDAAGSASPSSPRASRTIASRLGEALVFTTLMAPWNKSDGRLSRFTCEACH